MSTKAIQDLNLKVEGVSEFAHLLLDAMGSADGLTKGKVADVYEGYVKRQMAIVENLMDAEAA